MQFPACNIDNLDFDSMQSSSMNIIECVENLALNIYYTVNLKKIVALGYCFRNVSTSHIFV